MRREPTQEEHEAAIELVRKMVPHGWLTLETTHLVANAIAYAFAERRHENDGTRVEMPVNVDQARTMHLVSERWLRDHVSPAGRQALATSNGGER